MTRVSEDREVGFLVSPQGQKATRHRRFRTSSQALTRDSISNALDRPNVERYAGIVHDKDLYVHEHAHVVLEMRDGRTFQTVANMLGVPLILVSPVIGQKGDLFSFARAVRYLTHESPNEQAKGKYRYPDEEVFASIGYDWRGEIDALTGRETYSPALLDQLKLQVLLGERSARSVLDEYPYVYIRHDAVLEKLEQRFMREFATPTQRELRMEEYRWRTEARG